MNIRTIFALYRAARPEIQGQIDYYMPRIVALRQKYPNAGFRYSDSLTGFYSIEEYANALQTEFEVLHAMDCATNKGLHNA